MSRDAKDAVTRGAYAYAQNDPLDRIDPSGDVTEQANMQRGHLTEFGFVPAGYQPLNQVLSEAACGALSRDQLESKLEMVVQVKHELMTFIDNNNSQSIQELDAANTDWRAELEKYSVACFGGAIETGAVGLVTRGVPGGAVGLVTGCAGGTMAQYFADEYPESTAAQTFNDLNFANDLLDLLRGG